MPATVASSSLVRRRLACALRRIRSERLCYRSSKYRPSKVDARGGNIPRKDISLSDEDSRKLPGVHASPNIQRGPEIYEIENEAADPDGLVERAMAAVAPWTGTVVLDLGAGTGFHIARFHDLARHVIAVEPHDASRLRAMERAARLGLARASVMTGSAEHLLLADQSVDIVHSRFAYFFGPGCEPGLREVERVVRPGGTVFIVDNDLRSGTFSAWLERSPWDKRDADVVERFWAEQGFRAERFRSAWRFRSRDDLEAVLRLEFPPELAEQLMAEHEGLEVEYHYALYHRTYGKADG